MKTVSESRARRHVRPVLLLAAMAAVALVSAGCTIIIDPSTKGSLAVSLEPLSSSRGIVTLPEGIPPEIAAPSTLEAAQKRTGVVDAASKAWVRADKVLFELYKGSNLAFSAWSYPATSINTSSTLGVVSISEIPAGGYDWLKVSIYNNANGSDPVTIGWNSGITITGGSTSYATVNCIPVLVEDLTGTENTWSATASLGLRGEKWYKVPAALGTTTFFINRISGDLDLYVFDTSGVFVGNETSSSLGQKSKVFSTPDPTYYVALYGYAAGTAQVKYRNGGVP